MVVIQVGPMYEPRRSLATFVAVAAPAAMLSAAFSCVTPQEGGAEVGSAGGTEHGIPGPGLTAGGASGSAGPSGGEADTGASRGTAGGSRGESTGGPDSDMTDPTTGEPPGPGTGTGPGYEDPGPPPMVPCPEGGAVPAFVVPNELGDLPSGAAQNEKFCASAPNEHSNDVVRKAFCEGGAFTAVKGMASLLEALELNHDLSPTAPRTTQLAMLSHSTAVSGRFVSEINPRFVAWPDCSSDAGCGMGEGAKTGRAVMVAWTRGEPFVEIAAEHRVEGGAKSFASGRFGEPWNFYLLRFHKACEDDASCLPADFLTNDFDAGWDRVTLYQDEDLRHTSLDCLNCHAEGGAEDRRRILFVEDREGAQGIRHWFESGQERYFREFEAAWGRGSFGVLSGADVTRANGGRFWALWFAPLREYFDPGLHLIRYGDVDRAIASGSQSTEWHQAVDAFVAGASPAAPPHHRSTVADPEKLRAATEVIAKYRAGEIARCQLPDFRDVHDTSLFEETGRRVRAGQDGAGILRNACAQCHRAVTASGTRRGLFLTDRLDKLSDKEKAAVLDRVRRPATDPRLMPPRRFRELSEAEIQVVEAFLGKGSSKP